MGDDAKLKLTLRLAPADDRPPDPVVLDDIVRLIRQGVVTAPKDAPRVTAPAGGFHEPTDDEKRTVRSLESKVENRIQEASAASQAAVEQRAETANLPDASRRLAEESLKAAEQLVAAVQRAILRRVTVHVPESTT